VRSPGHKHGKLNILRIGTAYPRLRKCIAVTRGVSLVLIALLLTAVVLSIVALVIAVLWRDSGLTSAQVSALVTAIITGLIWAGIVFLASELICGGLDVLVDLGDQALERSIDQDVAQRSQSGYSGEFQPPVDPPTPMAVAPVPVAAPEEPPLRRSSPRPAPASAAERSERSGEADITAASRLLELAQRHSRNGNKPEAVRCLREIVSRYGSTEAAAAARRALGKVS
jgi:hypothetical protein